MVQGVGFRPFVKREADRLDITGTVQNKGSYVEIIAHGSEEKIHEFYDVINNRPPERAVILRSEIKEEPEGDRQSLHNFGIIESAHREGEKFIPPDIGICDKCREELYDPKNRRFLHPFINCTQCGPRFTILTKLPYDRERTSMEGFPMCRECENEYYDRESRRFDAQPVCCNNCGPEVYVYGSSLKGLAAISETRKVIKSGGIAAIKGIGGFHLCCDAGNEEAVKKLRERKRRPGKPFALMLKDIETVRRECVVDDIGEKLLKGYQRPIVLLKRRKGGCAAQSVAPGNPDLGVMMPYAPVHLLLFDLEDGIKDFPDALVMTSGNVSGAPITISDEEADRELGAFTDIILSNNREILTRADDSVLDIFEGKARMIRRSRGYAPLPVIISPDDENAGGTPVVLAVGGELKNTFCIKTGNDLYPSAYVGDLTDIRSGKALINGILRMEELLETEEEIIVSDMHPGYNSRRIALNRSKQKDIRLIELQHHYAHILSVMAENDEPGPVIGAAFDGTGYGTDGSIWGGEILKADRKGFERLSHISPFRQPGGDASAEEGWRIALSLIHEMCPEREKEIIIKTALCPEEEADIIIRALDKGDNYIMSTSCGRLFDAVSAVLGFCRSSGFEGEAAMYLQFAAERYEERAGKDECGEPLSVEVMSTNDLFLYILAHCLMGEDRDRLALVFHRGLSGFAISEISACSEKTGIKTAALSGGCFQNRLLLRLVKEGLENKGLKVLINRQLPANDSGIAAGQCYYEPDY